MRRKLPIVSSIEPEFVDLMPRELTPGLLYVSIKYATTQHLCACGCGKKVVLPLSPADWSLRYDGETISMSPSIGNWEYTCKSHYWIDRNRIHWGKSWTRKQIEVGRKRDSQDMATYLEMRSHQSPPIPRPERSDSSLSRIFLKFRNVIRR
jgi:hypothetical protein